MASSRAQRGGSLRERRRVNAFGRGIKAKPNKACLPQSAFERIPDIGHADQLVRDTFPGPLAPLESPSRMQISQLSHVETQAGHFLSILRCVHDDAGRSCRFEMW